MSSPTFIPFFSLLLFMGSDLYADTQDRVSPSQSLGSHGDYTDISSKPVNSKKLVAPRPENNTPKVPRPSSTSGQTLSIKDVRIVGNECFDDSTLLLLLADKVGKSLTFNQIMGLAATIEAYYNDQGYHIVRVFVPEGGYKNGVLTIEILEGKLGDIKVKGAKRYSDADLVAVVSDYLSKGKIFKLSDAEVPLTLLNTYPALELSSTLSPGTKTGTTDMTLVAKEKSILSGSLELNNFGSEDSGEYRFIPYMVVRSPFGWGDQLSAYAAIAIDEPDSWSYQLDYRVPVSRFGTSALLYFGQGNNAVGNEFEILDINGDSYSWGVGVSHLQVFSAYTQLTWELAFDAQDVSQDVLGVRTLDDSIRKLRLSVNLDHSDMSGRTIASLAIHQGLGEMLGGMDNDSAFSSRSFAGANNEFTKFVLGAVRVQRLSENFSAIINFTGQYSTDPLLSSEQMYLGGANSVRGQAYSAASGDDGFLLNAELRYSIFESAPSLQLAAFYDMGMVHTKEPFPGQDTWETAMGAGVGVRSEIFKGLDLRADVAVPLGEKHGDDMYFYIQARYQF